MWSQGIQDELPPYKYPEGSILDVATSSDFGPVLAEWRAISLSEL